MKSVGIIAIAMAISATMGLAQEQSSQDQVVRPVKLQIVEETQLISERQFFGQVVARQTVDLAFQVGGQIVEFPVIEGETIPKGSVIAQLDLETFELSLDQARLQKDQADRTVERLSQLSGNSVSQVSRDDAETQASLSAIAVRNAEYALEHATLHAPFDALIASRNLPNFATISAGTPIVRLHDMSELRIEIDVPEVLFQRAGRDPNVTISAVFPASDEVFPLEVREFNAESSTIGQTFRITFGMTPPEDLVILPGSSVTVHVRSNGGALGIELPTEALLPQTDGSVQVMVFHPQADDQGAIEARSVVIEPTPRGGFAVLSGLEVGEEVVIAGGSFLSDGQQVRRFAGFQN